MEDVMILLSWGRSRKFKTQKLFAKVHHCSLPKKQNFPCQDYTISSITVLLWKCSPNEKSKRSGMRKYRENISICGFNIQCDV